MNRKQLYKAVIDWFLSQDKASYVSELTFENGYQLLVAVMLSAQCTDKRVNMVTPALFNKYPTPEALSKAPVEDVYEFIKSVSYPNSKAQHLVEMAKMLFERFGSVPPDTTEELQQLPGVGRKTANVVASILYNKAVIAVDTHVFRLSNRLGLSSGDTPLKVEADLTKNIPAEYRAQAHHWLLLHGRYICTSRAPKCGECPFAAICKFYNTSVESNKMSITKSNESVE